MKNSRRAFLKQGTLAAGAVAVVTACGGKEQLPAATPQTSSSDITVNWRLATSWSKNFPVFEHGALRFAENVKQMSGGRFTIAIDSANKHKAPFEVFDMVQGGQYQMGHSASYYWKGKESVMSILTTTPFGMNVQEQNAWFWYGGGIELMEKVYAKHGLLSYNAGNTGVQMGGWFRKEITSLQDMQGLKMRIPGLAGEVLAHLGVQPVNIPGGELYTALERNTIDALEWVGPHLDLSMGFQQIAEYYYTGWHEPAAELQFLVNQSAMESLPEDLKAILMVAMKEASFDTSCEFFYTNVISWGDMQEKYPAVKIRHFPQDVIDELKKQTKIVLAEMADASPIFREVWNSQSDFLAKSRRWNKVSEYSYLTMRDYST